MDKIWYRNPSKSEVIGRCGGVEKNEWPRRSRQKSLKKEIKDELNIELLLQYRVDWHTGMKLRHRYALIRYEKSYNCVILHV